MKKTLSTVGFLALTAAAGAAHAQSAPTINGELGFGLRYYVNDGLFRGQSEAGAGILLDASIFGGFQLGQGDVAFDLYGILDDQGGRDYFNLRKLYYAQTFGDWDVLLGYNVENWGVAESRSISNVINATNQSNTLDREELFGTPMLNVNYTSDWGVISGYALFGIQEPFLADAGARSRSIWSTDGDRASYQEDDDVDFALRYTNNWGLGGGTFDFSASYFYGTSRNPMLLPGCVASVGPITEEICDGINDIVRQVYEAGFPPPGDDNGDFWDTADDILDDELAAFISSLPAVGFVPYYQHIQQAGITGVYATGDVQLRFEGIFRDDGIDDFFSVIVGGDYTFQNVGPDDGSVTLVAEYLWDERGIRQPYNPFENDLFLGLNYVVNDPRDTRMSLGGFIDLDSAATLFTMTASTRINDNLRAEFGASIVETNGWNDPLAFIARDDFMEFKLTSFF